MNNQQRFSGEWKTRRLGDIASIRNQKVMPENVNPDTFCVELEHIASGNGKLLEYSIAEYSTASKYRFSAGDVLFGRLRSYLRKYWLADRDGICTTEIWPLMVDAKQIDSRFLHAVVQTDQFFEMANISYGTHMPRTDWTVMRNFMIMLPPIQEQRAIAEVLSDVDGLINALDTLIAKKRAIKQATMQSLLTGKTRLPGFSGEWETKRLGDLLTYKRPDMYIVKSTEYSDHGNVPVLTANKAFILGYTDEDFGICQNYPVIVFDDFTTDNKYAAFPFKVKSSAIKLLYPKHEHVSLRFVFERMQLIDFPLGNHKRYYISEYQNLELPVPDFDEQRAIAAVLSDMDAEIAALEQRREKTIAIKQGMMQQLLTGKVRLSESRIITDDAD